MVLKTWPPAGRIPFYVAPELLSFLKNNRSAAESPLSWSGVEDEPLEIDSGDENEVCFFINIAHIFNVIDAQRDVDNEGDDMQAMHGDFLNVIIIITKKIEIVHNDT